jgi:shikimate dehydrogenase
MIRAFITGWPVAHSRSPLIHSHWLKQYGIEGEYRREAVVPADFATFLRGIGEAGYRGGNVTLPHKEEAFRLVDETDEVARAIGAINTVWLEDRKIFGTNTDVAGFLANLDAEAPAWDKAAAHALVLGAGGAARGIVYGLLSRGVEAVTVANRTLDKAEQVSAAMGKSVRAIGLNDVAMTLPGVDLLVNTTSLGMVGQPPLDLALDGLKSSAVVADAVYVPLETELLRRSRDRGHRVVGGLGMLLHQAVPGFERWFGQRPTVTADLTTLIEADVRRSYP